MPNKYFGFDKQKKVGLNGEADFLKFYSNLLPVKSKDKKYDFILQDGKKIEVKTDTYSILKTPNFFMEKYGEIDKKKLGGPWRALKDEIDYFVYYFAVEGIFFWFKPSELVEFLEGYVNSNHEKVIESHTWSTLGYAVPREACMHLVWKMDRIEKRLTDEQKAVS